MDRTIDNSMDLAMDGASKGHSIALSKVRSMAWSIVRSISRSAALWIGLVAFAPSAWAASVSASGTMTAASSSQTSKSSGDFGRLEVRMDGGGSLSTAADNRNAVVVLSSPSGIGQALLKAQLAKGASLKLFLPLKELEGLELSVGGVLIRASSKHPAQEWCEDGKPAVALPAGDLRRLGLAKARRHGVDGFEVVLPQAFLDKLAAGEEVKIHWVDFYR